MLSQQSRSSYLIECTVSSSDVCDSSLMRNSKAALPWTMFNVSSEYTFFTFCVEFCTVKNEEFGLLFGGVIMGSNTYGEFK